MTPNMSKTLSEILGVDLDLTTTDKTHTELKIIATNEATDSLESQREYVKKNIVSLIEKGVAALDEMLAVAKSTEVGKDYKVASDMIAALVDHNITLLDAEVAHKPKIDKEEISEKSLANITTNNTVFVGSTTDLGKHLRNNPISNSSNIVENGE